MVASMVVLLGAGDARAQNFPGDGACVPLRCGNRNMFDPARDQPGAVDERDIVGDQADPAGLRAIDAQFLYLRMRLDADPAPGGTPTLFSWGFAFDTDDDPNDYEALLTLDGPTGTIALYRNSATTAANSPADPADQPPLSTGMFALRGRSNGANGGDRFLDLAISWADLQAVGLGPATPVRIWAGTSTMPDRLDLDIACHDGAGGPPSLDRLRPHHVRSERARCESRRRHRSARRGPADARGGRRPGLPLRDRLARLAGRFQLALRRVDRRPAGASQTLLLTCHTIDLNCHTWERDSTRFAWMRSWFARREDLAPPLRRFSGPSS
jgi:hypothetical protein